MACSHAAAHRDTAVPRPPAPHPARPARAGRHARRLLRPPSRAAPDTAGTAPRTAPDQRRHGLVSDTRVIHRPSAARCAEVRRQQRRIVPGDHLGSNLRRSAAGNSKTAYRAPVAQLLIQHCFHRWPWLEPAVWPARHLVLMDQAVELIYELRYAALRGAAGARAAPRHLRAIARADFLCCTGVCPLMLCVHLSRVLSKASALACLVTRVCLAWAAWHLMVWGVWRA